MKYRHLIILLITLCILVLVTGCNKQHTDNTEGDSSLTSSNNETAETFNQSYSLAKYMSFEESLSNATHIVMATFTGKTQIQDGAQDYLFTVETVLKGEFKTADFMYMSKIKSLRLLTLIFPTASQLLIIMLQGKHTFLFYKRLYLYIIHTIGIHQ